MRPRRPAPALIRFRLRLDEIYPVRFQRTGWDLAPEHPHLAQSNYPSGKENYYPVLEDSDGVGFEPTVGLPLLLISSQVH